MRRCWVRRAPPQLKHLPLRRLDGGVRDVVRAEIPRAIWPNTKDACLFVLIICSSDALLYRLQTHETAELRQPSTLNLSTASSPTVLVSLTPVLIHAIQDHTGILMYSRNLYDKSIESTHAGSRQKHSFLDTDAHKHPHALEQVAQLGELILADWQKMILNVCCRTKYRFWKQFYKDLPFYHCFTIVLLYHLEISRFLRLMCPELLGSSLVQRREAQFVVCSQQFGVIGS